MSDTGTLLSAASARVRGRLNSRPRTTDEQFVAHLGPLAAGREREALALAHDLATLIGVDVGCLRAEDGIRSLLRVHRVELPPNVQQLFGKLGLTDVVDPFAFNLLDFVERRIEQDVSRLQREKLQPLPATEDEWIERIASLTVGELVDALL